MKCGYIFFENDLNKLNKRRNNENEYDSLEIFKLETAKKEIVDRMSYRSCQDHYEGNGNTHSRSLSHLFGNTEEGADTEELCQHVVIYKNRREDNINKTFYHFSSPSFFWHASALFPAPLFTVQNAAEGHPLHENSFLGSLLKIHHIFVIAVFLIQFF